MKVFLYLLDTMADWEYGFLLAELNSKRYFLKDRKDLEIIKVSDDKRPKVTMGGIPITADVTVGEMRLAREDMLILPGSDRWLEKENERILAEAKEYVDDDMNVAAICGATVGLAKYGALDMKHHTSNDREFLKMFCPEYKGEAKYMDKPVVEDRNLITAAGTAPLEFSYEVIRHLNVFSEDTLSNWYNLYEKREAKYFFGLMDSLKGKE